MPGNAPATGRRQLLPEQEKTLPVLKSECRKGLFFMVLPLNAQMGNGIKAHALAWYDVLNQTVLQGRIN